MKIDEVGGEGKDKKMCEWGKIGRSYLKKSVFLNKTKSGS